MLESLQNCLLGLRVINFATLYDILLVKNLHGIDLPCSFVLALDDCSKGALTNYGDQFKVVRADLRVTITGTSLERSHLEQSDIG
jgi:hypothetical protein